jgi:hypothetical protein
MAVDSTRPNNNRRRKHDRRSQPDRVCVVCLEGVYTVREEREYRQPDGPVSPWHIEACTRCGHVQFFRRDWRQPE